MTYRFLAVAAHIARRGAIVPASALVCAAGSANAMSFTGPSSSASPYITPIAAGVQVTSLLTVGDSVAGYRMVGIPDGLGAYDNGDGTFSVLMNHELGNTQGVARAHGATGAFVSRWTIRKSDGAVLSGSDLINTHLVWDTGTSNWVAATGSANQFNRFCSADLPEQSAFFNSVSGLGTTERIFMNGEEAGNEGRAYGTVVSTGVSYQLARLGKFSWENSVANPFSGDTTLVIGTDDSTPGQVYVYKGSKTNTGNAIERAGLNNGALFGVRVSGVANEDRTNGLGAASSFDLFNFGDVSATSGATLQASSVANNVTQFLRPEDGHWDPNSPNDFYFVTTDRFDQVSVGTGAQVGRSRLWRMRFDDITNPTGGSIDMLLDGTEGGQMYDNMTIDRYGNVILQEDPGGQAWTAKIWNYNIASDSLTLLAEHDPSRFGNLIGGVASPATAPFSNDEESSGIIDATDILGAGWFLMDVQAHYGLSDPELVQGGQLLAFFNPFSVPTPGAATLVALAALGAGVRRRR